jgi:hypothetical protein
VGDDGVDADEHDQPGVLDVDVGIEARGAAHQIGHQHLGGAVDGQRAEPRPCADRSVQRLAHPVTRRVHADPAAEEDADRVRAVLVDDGAEPDAEVVQARFPGRRLQEGTHSHQRTFHSVRVVMHLRERPSLRARVAVRQRVAPIAAHPHDPVTRHVDEDPAHGRADPAEAPYGFDLAVGHDRSFYEPDSVNGTVSPKMPQNLLNGGTSSSGKAVGRDDHGLKS